MRYSVTFNRGDVDNTVAHLGTVDLDPTSSDGQILEALQVAGMMNRHNEGLTVGESSNGDLYVITSNRIAWTLSPVVPDLRGTPAQVRYASQVRAAWLAAQVEVAGNFARYGRGEARESELVDATPGDLEVFARTATRVARGLETMVAERVTAAAWLESPERRWFDAKRRFGGAR